MSRLAAVLLVLLLSAGLAACGGDDEPAAESAPATTVTVTEDATETEPAEATEPTETMDHSAAGDEPVSVEATITAIEQSGGDPDAQVAPTTVLTVQITDGDVRKVVIPPDLALDATAERVLKDPACAGKVLANLELVDAPSHEQLGDAILVTAQIDTESC